MMEGNKKEDINLFKILKVVSPMVYKGAKTMIIVMSIMGAIHGGSWVVSTIVTQKLFDSVTNVANKSGAISTAILIALLLGVVHIASQVLNGAFNFGGSVITKKVSGCISKIVNEKCGRLDPIDFENKERLDDINKAHKGIFSGVNIVFIVFMLFTCYLPYFILMGIYLYSLNPILSLSLMLIFAPVALTQIIRVKIFGDLEDEVAPVRREYEYYEKCIVDKEYFKETRLLGAFLYFKNLYKDSLKLLNKKTWEAERKSGLMELLMKVITLIGYMGVLYLLFTSLMKGKISVGAFAAVFSSIGLMFTLMEEIICRHIGDVTRNIGTARNLIRFLELPERQGEDIEIKKTPAIKLKNVSFAYPGVAKNSLENINLEINSGETIAIVGENGAGKTTLVKLITGLYLPKKGQVTINEIDTASISPKSLYKNISAVFQKYQKYKMTLEENIIISNMKEKDEDKNKSKMSSAEIAKSRLKNNAARLEMAIESADLKIDEEKFPKGYETMLSREFGGVDLSGGQWQRVAIARGVYSPHNIIILDEPTASIDPVEENRIYTKFEEMAQGNTSIVVTHRLGSAKIADKIIVMNKGRVVEIGNHEQLIRKKGKYEEMYNAQSKWYVNS